MSGKLWREGDCEIVGALNFIFRLCLLFVCLFICLLFFRASVCGVVPRQRSNIKKGRLVGVYKVTLMMSGPASPEGEEYDYLFKVVLIGKAIHRPARK